MSNNKEEHPRDNLYMWGHYGDGHRGIAIEFDTSVLADLYENQYNFGGESPWWKMDYNDKIPEVEYEYIYEFIMSLPLILNDSRSSELKISKYIKELVCLKAKVWEDEKEWRLVHRDGKIKLKIYRHDLQDNAITAVYVGCRTAKDEGVKNNFIDETRRNFPNAKVFLAKMRQGGFALDFEKIYPAT